MLLTTFDPFRPWTSALAMDVIRRESEVELRLDLPGADPDSIEVTTDHGVLTVSARRSEEYTEQDRPVRRERVMGSFSRQIRLAEAVDTDKIEAGYDNGVLSVVLPVKEQAKPRKIEIKGAKAPELAA